jgi:RNA polymerase sigma-70 factor (ECF subfamily)
MRREPDDAYDDLYRTEHAAIVHAAHLVVGDLEVAREIAQDAFAALYAHWPKVAGYDRPGAWVRRVAIRMAVKAARARERADAAEAQSHPDDVGASPPGDDAEVIAAVRALPTNQRAAVVLFYFQDASIAEVADTLGCRPSTAKVHLHRARQRLAEQLGTEARDVVG